MKFPKMVLALGLIFGAVGPSLVAAADNYPSRPISLIVPFAPGGGNDTLGRLFGQKLSESLGQSVVVENRPGAGTTIASAYVARSKPDGYTLLLSSIASHAVSPHLYRDPGYDPIKDFAPVALLGIAPVILAVNTDVPAHSVKELVELAKSKPGGLKFGTGGVGSVMHTSGMVFSQTADIEMLHVPYKGAGPAYIALMSGEVDLVIDTAAALMPHIKGGKLRGLAISRAERLPDAPDLPTFSEEGMPGFQANGWYSIHAPAGTPDSIIRKLNGEIVQIMKTPEVQERLKQLGTEVVEDNSPEKLAEFGRAELEKYEAVIKKAGVFE